MQRHTHFLATLFVFWMLSGTALDGQTITYHELPTQAQLPVANVNVVMQDSEGYLWYGTAGGGICQDDGYRVVAYNSKTAGTGVMESDEVTCMAEDQQGKIWFGTRAGTYYIYKQDRSVHRVKEEGMEKGKVSSIAVGHDGCVWIGIKREVARFSPDGILQDILKLDLGSREEVKELTVDSKGTVWVTILRGGIWSIDPKTDKTKQQKPFVRRNPWNYPYAASYMLEDTVHHRFWIGTWGGGIVSYPPVAVERATLVTSGSQKFGSEVNHLWMDEKQSILWASTMDDVYAYKMGTDHQTDGGDGFLRPFDTSSFMPKGKKIVGKLAADKRGNLWVAGISPHTFVLAKGISGNDIRRDEVKAMAEQMGYKIMVGRIVREGDYYWIYQNRTRLSLYNGRTGELAFMATDASPEPLSTQRVLASCKEHRGVWTCNGKRLIHAWHDGMTICWEEVEEARTPNYISALSDEGNGKLLIGTEKQVLLYDYYRKVLTPLTDSVGIVQQVGYDTKGVLSYTTDPKAQKRLIDGHGHVWTLDELTLTEQNPKTGAYRVIHASDKHIGMDSFADIFLYGDSICLGGMGAFCMVGRCKELDEKRPDEKVVLTGMDSLQYVYVSTMNHLHAQDIQFAYRFNGSGDWTELPKGTNQIDITGLRAGHYTLQVKATDEFGVWHKEQEVCSFSVPCPWYLRWYMGCILLAGIGGAVSFGWKWKRGKEEEREKGKGKSEKFADAVEQEEEDEKEEKAKVEKDARPTKHPFLERVETIVEAHLDEAAYSVEDLCKDLGMSRMNMYRKFQSISDVTPSEFIRKYRLNKAAQLLRDSNKSVTEVAYQVGFTSPQYFAKCFKDEFGVTPKQACKGM